MYILMTFLILIVVGALFYFGGVFGGNRNDVEININKPGVILGFAR